MRLDRVLMKLPSKDSISFEEIYETASSDRGQTSVTLSLVAFEVG